MERILLQTVSGVLRQACEVSGTGHFAVELAQLFIERSPLKAQDIVTAANKNAVFSMLQNMRALKTVVIGTNPAQNAQVCTGGISFAGGNRRPEAKRFPVCICAASCSMWTVAAAVTTSSGHGRADRSRERRLRARNETTVELAKTRRS